MTEVELLQAIVETLEWLGGICCGIAFIAALKGVRL